MTPKYLFEYLEMLFLHLLHGNQIDLVSDPHGKAQTISHKPDVMRPNFDDLSKEAPEG